MKGLITELISPVRVRFNRVASENVFEPLHPETGASLHFQFCQLDVTFDCDYL